MNRHRALWRIVGAAGLLIVWLGSGDLRSQDAPKEQQRRKDLEAIHKASHDFVAAFARGDATAVAALWTEEGDYIDESGQTFAGREAIAKEYARFFAANRGAKLRIVIDGLRLLSDSAAIEDGRAMLEPAPEGAPAISKYTAVHIKVDGKWLMSTVRDTRVETPSSYSKLADLEWLLGSWSAEEQGATSEVECRWVANKSFLERSYRVSLPNQAPTSGVQLIGFNGRTGQIQSWSFASDGGHAVGAWTPRENGWTIETTGMLGDGTETSSVNHLIRLDDNGLSWQAVERRAGGVALPDTDEIVLKRKP